MSTFTIRVTSSATNTAGTAYGQQPDLGAPSFLDMVVTNSTDPLIVNGVYDAYCLNPLIDITLSPTSYLAESSAGDTLTSFAPVGFASLTQVQVDQINWLLAQNFTSDAKYAGQFNYGEVQTAIWKLIGFTDAQIDGAGLDRFLNDNNRNVVSDADIDFLISGAQTAIASGNGVLPTDAFFTTVIDPSGNVQPLIVQLQSAKLGNYVWSDADADGIQDAGEAGVDHVIVELYDGNGVLIASTVTGDDFSTAAVEQGYYQFTGLKAGDYQVKFVAPAGQFLTTQDANANTQDAADSDANVATGFSQVVTLAAGESNQTIDAGLVPAQVPPASLGDYVWLDSNNDGQQNDGNTGVNGVTVNLYTAAGSFVATTMTADNAGIPGYYLFANLTPGDYKVEFIAPAGYALAQQDLGNDASDSDADQTTGMTIATTLTSGENDLSWDAGLVKLASLGDRVWEDSNANGVQDTGESGIGNVTVKLYDCNTNLQIATTTTDANGNYSFSGLMPGVYHVEFVAPNGYVYSAQDVTAEALGTDSDANSAGITACYTVNSGDAITTVDAGLYQTASLGDYVWLDNNNDGQQNDGNTGVNGVTVNLYTAAGAFVATTVTADNAGIPGYYLFANLTPGDYKVEFIAPAGYALAQQDLGNDASDSDADQTTGMTIATTLTSGENDLSWDAGLVKLASLGDRVWEDSNANGVQDTGESGIGNVTVKLYDCNTNLQIATTTTDANGNYSFSGLMPGVYHVEFVAPNGYVYSAQDVTAEALGTDSDANSAGITACYTVNSGDVITTVDAGMYRTASLGDYVWLDNNNDGQQNDGNTGVNGVTVNLYTAAGAFVATTVTADNAGIPGYYLFANLTPGDYKVEFIAPAGYALAQQDLGNDASDSDADQTTGMTIATTLTSGENDLSWDAGLVKLASLGDRVWEDSNANGVQDNGETGLGNVTVKLYDCTTNLQIATTTTDANGNYSFSGLMPGVYHVEFVAPNGYVYSAQDVTAEALGTDSDANSAGITACYTVNSGDVITTVDAGMYRTASLGDYVWLDNNNDGQQNDGNTGVNGVTVNLYTAAGAFVATTVTADNAGIPGYYLFANLIPGDYKVEFIAPAGYALAQQDLGNDASDSDADQTTGMTIATTLISGENDLSWDAGLVKLASLGDRVWEDSNANGVQDNGETGLGNVTVKLYDCTTNLQIATTTTDANGNYSFSGLMPGVYHVEFVAPNGYVYSAQDVTAEALGTDSDANSAGITACYTVNSGDVITTVDAGLYQQAHLGDRIWEDTNANGQQDAGENGIANVTVQLKDVGGNIIATTSTDANGLYGFDVLPGTYSVLVTAPAGYVVTAQNSGNDASDSDINGSGQTGSYTLGSGQTDLSVDGGLYRTAELGDRVWLDSNGNGQQDIGESGVANVTVNLKDANGNIVGTQSTDANGNYLFTNLTPGTYSVAFVAPAGYIFTSQDQGADATDSDANSTMGATIQTVLDSGESDRTWDAGLQQKASIGDRVWLDKNANGVQDLGEAGLSGVTVNLLNAAGAVIGSTTTNASGNYLFSALNPGDYAIQVVAPAGYTVTGKDLGGNDATDSDIDAVTGKTINTTLISGENDLSWDAGLYRKAAIGDKVWLDKNANGVQDAGEAGIGGITVNLLNAAGTVILSTTTTDANGNYLFNNLVPGDYSVQVVAPAGYYVSPKDAGGNDATDSDIDAATGKTVATNLTSGETDLTWDAGVYQKASIGDYVWNDADRDGVQDANEVGIGGVTVRLLDCNNNDALVATQVTNASGYYNFSDLMPGAYKVQFVAPNGYVLSTQDAVVATDATDSDANSAGLTGCYTLNSGDDVSSVDAGMYLPSVGIDIEKYVRGRYTDETGGGEGLTPGFWKSHSIYGPAPLSGWPETGYSPDDSYESVFGVSIAASNPTLLDALGMNGGGMNALMRHSAAALLNASNPNVDYEYSKAQVIAMTQSAFASGVYEATKDLFVAQNELGADLDTPAGGGTVIETPDYDADSPTGPLIPVGGQAIFTYVVTNTGETALSNVQVTDDRIANLTFVGGDSDNDGKLDTNETWTYTATETVQPGVQYVNIGTATGVDAATSRSVNDSDAAHYTTTALTASLGDLVWLDANGNGVQDAGEAGVAGVSVKLLNGAGGVVNTATTDANGNYLFTNLALGDYAIQVVAPSGYLITGKDLGGNDTHDSDVDQTTGKSVLTNITAGENDLSWDAGLVKLASIGDRVWYDDNANGIQDAGEGGVANVVVELRANVAGGAGGTVLATTTTDANGNYLFDNLTPGDYHIDIQEWTLPSGYQFTNPNQGNNDGLDSDVINTASIPLTWGVMENTTLTSGENDMSWDVGIVRPLQPASIGDKVWLDCDGDGIQDANEIGVEGVTVKLLDGSGSVLGTTTTDFEGNYLFNNLTPGDYAIQVMTPAGYSVTAKDRGGNDALDSDIDQATGKTIVTSLSSGENDMSWDAGLTTVGACLDLDLTGGTNSGSTAGNIRTYTMNGLSVHASAFSRVDSTGAWAKAYLASYSGGLGVTDTSEDGATPSHAIDNVGGRDNYILLEFDKTVLLDKAFLGWVSNDSDVQVWIGNFNNPYNSHLTLSDSVLTSMGFMEVNTTTLSTTRWADLNAGDYAGNTIVIAADASDISPEDYFKLQTLSLCTPACGLTASIGDKVWIDSDCDGVQDAGEAGAVGVTVKLLNTAGSVLATTTTDSAGEYLFSDLAPGDYAIQVVAPTGYAFTSKDLGGNDATDSDVDTSTGKTLVTSLAGGENDLSWDAGLKLVPTKASIGNKVWHDLDYDGIQDSGEAGIANVTVKLLNSAGTVLATTTTNSAGEYLFSNLTPGDFKVQVVKPSGYYTTKQNQGSNDGIDSDVSSTGYTALTNLVAGENDMSWDAGLYKKASIGDKVWEDKDHDDIQDSTEPGIGNVKVMLQNSSGTTISTTYTNSYGNYKFTNLDPGTYRLVFDKTNTTYNGISMTKWKWASKNIGSNDSIDSDVNGDGVSLHNVAYTDYTTLTSGENDMTWDAAITPIVIDLNGNGIQTVARANSTGTFDLLGSGKAIDSGWLSGDDGFLAVDANGNGKVDSIAELFGGLGKGDGFAKLASFDSNGDGVVNADDSDFASLKIWQDVNGNHQTDAGELMGLAEAGVASLAVAYAEVPFVDANGNLHLERSSATLADGSSVDMTDVYFNVAAEVAAAAGVDVASLGQLLGDDSGLDGLLAGLGGGVGMAISASADMPANADVFDTAGLDAMKQMAALYEEQAAACCA